jgi:hypothetical protein
MHSDDVANVRKECLETASPQGAECFHTHAPARRRRQVDPQSLLMPPLSPMAMFPEVPNTRKCEFVPFSIWRFVKKCRNAPK